MPFRRSLGAGRGGRDDTVAILRYLAALKDRLRADLRPTNRRFRLRVADGQHGFESRTGFGIQTCFAVPV
jgi:hypothetical protein